MVLLWFGASKTVTYNRGEACDFGIYCELDGWHWWVMMVDFVFAIHIMLSGFRVGVQGRGWVG